MNIREFHQTFLLTQTCLGETSTHMPSKSIDLAALQVSAFVWKCAATRVVDLSCKLTTYPRLIHTKYHHGQCVPDLYWGLFVQLQSVPMSCIDQRLSKKIIDDHAIILRNS